MGLGIEGNIMGLDIEGNFMGLGFNFQGKHHWGWVSKEKSDLSKSFSNLLKLEIRSQE